MSKCRTCGKGHEGPHTKMRSPVKPVTKADKKLSVKHLEDAVVYNKSHIADHKKLEKNGGSKKYNESHIKGHEKALKEDENLLEARKKDLAKSKRSAYGYSGVVPEPKVRASKKLLRGMKGWKR